MHTANIVRENTYLDSIILMSISNQLKQMREADEVSLIMGSESNKGILSNIGLLTPEGERAKPGDLVIALRVVDKDSLPKVLEKAVSLIDQRVTVREARKAGHPISYEGALVDFPSANLVVVSVPGQYAGSVALDALESGRHVMIFSDNVTLEEEIRLKNRARELDLLVMGPDCGTAIIGGIALGFANAVRKGPVGIVGASGTGIQEVTTLIHRMGYGITHAVGVGGRDLSREVNGASMLQAIDALDDDPDTKLVVLLSKPPAPEVADRLLDAVKGRKKKYVVAFLNGDPDAALRRKLPFASGLEEAAGLAVSLIEKRPFRPAPFTGDVKGFKELAQKERRKMGRGKVLRGLFSGGTLADEALLILSRDIGDIHSNIPLKKELRLKDSWKSTGHTIVDMGEDEFTRGRPHPMIDYSLRCKRLLKEAADRKCGAILLDVVLGYGAHPSPASELAPVIVKARQKARKQARHLAIAASITGTDDDPQGYTRQKAALEEAGVTVLPSNAQAARYAGLLLKDKK
jgi:FdrA protein